MDPSISIRRMMTSDIGAVVALQPLAFPPPFDPELLWVADHIEAHLRLFPSGQFVAERGGEIIASCSNTRITEASWQAHKSWMETVGGPCLDSFSADGSTVYGLDVTVHPDHRRLGIAREFYRCRFALVESLGARRYGTACRIPGYFAWSEGHPERSPALYVQEVLAERMNDRTLSPLLRLGVTFVGVIENYMDDAESGDAAAMLEWPNPFP